MIRTITIKTKRNPMTLRSKFSTFLAVAALAVCAFHVPDAKAQAVTAGIALTLPDTTLSNETATASTRIKIPVPSASILAFQLTQVAAAAGTQDVVVKFNTSLDGIHWLTTPPITVTVALTGATAKTTITALGTNILAKYIAVESVATANTNVTLSNPILAFFPSPAVAVTP